MQILDVDADDLIRLGDRRTERASWPPVEASRPVIVDMLSSAGGGDTVIVAPDVGNDAALVSLASELAAKRVRLLAVVSRRAALPLAASNSSPDAVILASGETDVLLVSRGIEGWHSTSTGVELGKRMLQQRSVVRDLFHHAGLNLSARDYRVPDAEIDKWLDQHVFVDAPAKSLVWTVGTHRCSIEYATLRPRLDEIRDKLVKQLDDHFDPSVQTVAIDAVFMRRFGLHKLVREGRPAFVPLPDLDGPVAAWAAKTCVGDGLWVADESLDAVRVLGIKSKRSVAPPSPDSHADAVGASARARWGIAAVLLLSGVALGGMGYHVTTRGGHAAGGEDLAAARQQIEELSRQLTEQKALVGQQKTELDSQAGRARELEQQGGKLADVTRERDVLKGDNGRLTEQVNQLQRDLDTRTAELAEARKQNGLDGPRVLAVPQQFKTINEALAQAKAGDIVQIAPGTYRETLRLKSDVTVMGSADGRTIIEAEGAGDVVTASGVKNATLHGVVVDGRGTARTGIRISNASTATVTLCHVRRAEFNITVIGQGTRATLSYNVVSDSTNGYGLGFESGATGTASGNTCEGNKTAGIWVVMANTRAELTNNVCRNNSLGGIGFGDGATGTASGNTCEGNTWNGIAVFGADTTPTLRRNRCINNTNYGIYIEPGSGAAISNDNVLTGNGAGPRN